jgi:hypothetical protein
MAEIFSGFRNNIVTVPDLIKEIKARNNNKQSEEIDLLLKSYHY